MPIFNFCARKNSKISIFFPLKIVKKLNIFHTFQKIRQIEARSALLS